MNYNKAFNLQLIPNTAEEFNKVIISNKCQRSIVSNKQIGVRQNLIPPSLFIFIHSFVCEIQKPVNIACVISVNCIASTNTNI